MADTCSRYGRTLMIRFECGRCGFQQLEPYKDLRSLEENDYINTFYKFHPPKDWHELQYYGRLLCPKCAKAFEKFLCPEEDTENG